MLKAWTFHFSYVYSFYRLYAHGSLCMGWQCMERNLIVITFPADFISLLRHDVLEDGIWYLFRCVDCAPRPCSNPHHPVPYGHKLAHNVMPGLLIIISWRRLLSLHLPCAGQTNTAAHLPSIFRQSLTVLVLLHFQPKNQKTAAKITTIFKTIWLCVLREYTYIVFLNTLLLWICYGHFFIF